MLSLIQSNKVLKFAFVLCLCLCLLFVGSFRVNAAATAVGVVAAVALLCLAAWGVSTYATDMSGEDVGEYMQGEIDEWSVASGVAINGVKDGIGQTALGQFVLNPVAAKAMRLFGQWYINKHGIEAGGEAVQVAGGMAALPVPSGATFHRVVTWASGDYYDFRVNNADVVIYAFLTEVTTGNFYYNIVVASQTQTISLSDVRYRANGSVADAEYTRNVSLGAWGASGWYYTTRWSTPVNGGSIGAGIPVYETRNEGMEAVVGGVSDAGSLEMIPSDVIGIPSLEDLENKDLILDFGNLSAIDWYESVEKIFGDVAANDIDVTSQLVGEGAITTDDTVTQKPIVEGAEGVEWPDITQPIGVGGLEDYFPFCLPFDVAHFFEALAADPEAPSFEIPFVIPDLIDYTFEIDLSQFDQVASIFRTLELFAFIVGLAFVTRNFFIRG